GEAVEVLGQRDGGGGRLLLCHDGAFRKRRRGRGPGENLRRGLRVRQFDETLQRQRVGVAAEGALRFQGLQQSFGQRHFGFLLRRWRRHALQVQVRGVLDVDGTDGGRQRVFLNAPVDRVGERLPQVGIELAGEFVYGDGRLFGLTQRLQRKLEQERAAGEHGGVAAEGEPGRGVRLLGDEASLGEGFLAGGLEDEFRRRLRVAQLGEPLQGQRVGVASGGALGLQRGQQLLGKGGCVVRFGRHR